MFEIVPNTNMDSQNNQDSKIKVGQIYIDCDERYFVVTFIQDQLGIKNYNVIMNNGQVHNKFEEKDFKNYCMLVKEYPTWQEAIMSSEFRNEIKLSVNEFRHKIAPYMKHGWVAMTELKKWEYFSTKPEIIYDCWCSFWEGSEGQSYPLSMFEIEPVEDWRESLFEVGITNV